MKNINLIFTLILILSSCNQSEKSNNESYTPISHADMENAVIYEVNIRQYSKSGTFKAFTKDIPQLKQLGVKIIWVMPIFPISETKRKATGGDFAYLIEDEAERNKMLGSYYAVSDFTCSKDQELFLTLDGDDAFKVWLNGEKIAEAIAPYLHRQSCVATLENIKIKLKKGKNRILIKSANIENEWWVRARITDANNRPVELF